MKKEDYIVYLVSNTEKIKESLNGLTKVFRLELPQGWDSLVVEDIKAGYHYVKSIMENEYPPFARMRSQMPADYWKRHDSFNFCSDTEEHQKRKMLINRLLLAVNSNKRPDMFKKQYVRSKCERNKEKKSDKKPSRTGATCKTDGESVV